jgi:octaprenyl-diphosphate synthase
MPSPSKDSGPSLASLFDSVRDEFDALNRLIPTLLTSDVALVEEIGRYVVEAGGKRLRPLVVLLCGRACGAEGPRLVELAAVIELLHTATLLHDDVIDESMLRRGRATANAHWGNAPSVLVGDYLYSRAFQLMAGLDDNGILRTLADATNVIAAGEVEQLAQIGNTALDESQYLQVIRAKTAVLFEAAATTAGILGRADGERIAALTAYGLSLGTAYQLIDDALDYDGDVAALGKNVGDDLAEGKLTLPLIYTLAHGSEDDRVAVRAAVAGRDRDQLDAVVCAVRRSGALTYTRGQAAVYADRAIASANALPASHYRTAMTDLANLTIRRAF